MDTIENPAALKKILKSALVEVLEERGDLIGNAVEEALEDLHLARCMESARSAGIADRDRVAKLLHVSL